MWLGDTVDSTRNAFQIAKTLVHLHSVRHDMRWASAGTHTHRAPLDEPHDGGGRAGHGDALRQAPELDDVTILVQFLGPRDDRGRWGLVWGAAREEF